MIGAQKFLKICCAPVAWEDSKMLWCMGQEGEVFVPTQVDEPHGRYAVLRVVGRGERVVILGRKRGRTSPHKNRYPV